MSNKSKIPLIKNRFKIPKGYLENFNSKLISEFVPVTNDFLIPDEYFENISSRVIKQNKVRQNKVLKKCFLQSFVCSCYICIGTLQHIIFLNSTKKLIIQML